MSNRQIIVNADSLSKVLSEIPYTTDVTVAYHVEELNKAFATEPVSFLVVEKPMRPNVKAGVIEHFDRDGQSMHSGRAYTLPCIINHCEINKIPYRLTADPTHGYFIEKHDD